jgi:hypothetical protein
LRRQIQQHLNNNQEAAMKTIGFTLFVLLAGQLSLATVFAQAQNCDRTCLAGFADTWLTALAANDPAPVPLAPTAKITLNGKPVSLAQSFWDSAEQIPYRWDIANPRLGDSATVAVVQNADASKTMLFVRLKVQERQITEVELIKANEGDADNLWDIDTLTEVSPALTLSIPEAERDSHYRLVAAAESYWRAFQTNGTSAYKRADMLPDVKRIENGWQTTGMVRDGILVSANAAFDEGRFQGRNIWDRRYPVVDEERGIVLSIVRFGMQDGPQDMPAGPRNDRLVAEFFAVKNGMIAEIHAVLINLADSEPTGWDTDPVGPTRGGR